MLDVGWFVYVVVVYVGTFYVGLHVLEGSLFDCDYWVFDIVLFFYYMGEGVLDLLFSLAGYF